MAFHLLYLNPVIEWRSSKVRRSLNRVNTLSTLICGILCDLSADSPPLPTSFISSYYEPYITLTLRQCSLFSAKFLLAQSPSDDKNNMTSSLIGSSNADTTNNAFSYCDSTVHGPQLESASTRHVVSMEPRNTNPGPVLSRHYCSKFDALEADLQALK